MALRDRFTAAVRALTGPAETSRALAPVEQKHSQAMAAAAVYRVGIEQYAPLGYRRLAAKARTNPIVRRCVKLIAEAVADIEPVVKIGGREGAPGAEMVADKLKHPNPMQDRFAFMERLASFFVLHGNAFVEMASGLGNYREFYALRPELMTITQGEDGWAERYTYKPGTGAEKSWDVEVQLGRMSILHIQDFAPDDDVWGHGGLEAAELALQNYDSAWENALALFKNGAMPSGALKYNPTVAAGAAAPTLNDEQFARLKQQLADMTDTAKAKFKPMLLEGGLDWVQFAMTMVDMQADLLRSDAARDICRAFGVPPMLIGIPGDNTYSNYLEANRAFYRQTALPLAKRLYGAIARWWSGWLKQGGARPLVELHIDEAKIYALAEERKAHFEMLEQARFLKLDEKRAEAGYDPLPDGLGEHVYVDGFTQPLGATVRTAEAGAVGAEIGNESAEVALAYQYENPAYDPAKDADGDGESHDGRADSSAKKPAAKPKA